MCSAHAVTLCEWCAPRRLVLVLMGSLQFRDQLRTLQAEKLAAEVCQAEITFA